MWEKTKKIFAIIGAALAVVLGFFLFTRKKQQDADQSALTPEKQAEITRLEVKKEAATAKVEENHASIDALETAIKANDGKMDGVSKEVQGMSHDAVEEELRKRGLL